ncbi:MAG: penicillin-binding protein 2 [Gammaproteobacteria bacterium]|nr:penicillin-binding protein 2 [Gammaproteobacteria bacterium]
MIPQRSLSATHPARRWFVLSVFAVSAVLLLARAVDLQVLRTGFLREHGDARALRVVAVPAHRGMITDRNGEPLAISTPVDSVWVNPQEAGVAGQDPEHLARALGMQAAELGGLLRERSGREFVYLRRQIAPEQAAQVAALKFPGVYQQREYRRYYPAGEITGHLLGFTNIDDTGQEGVELAFDEWLRGVPGSKRVLRDSLGRTIQDIENITPASPGRQLTLSIDRRIQYLAHRELKRAVIGHGARGGSLVVLDVASGEVMAMVSQPAFNPNNREKLRSDLYRNRAVTDLFEPGSTVKPFTIAAALESGLFRPDTPVDARPGRLRIGGHTISDLHDYGLLDVTGVIRKSSNVGASKIALAVGPQPIFDLYTALGFGRGTGSGFPGEGSGQLQNYRNWSELELATIGFGYGLSATTLQLAHAYAVLGSGGVVRPVSLLKVETPAPGSSAMDPDVARAVLAMLETVISAEGTGLRARVDGYRVAGKTGTVHKSEAGGYAENRYLSLFAGIVPAGAPRLVAVVVIDEPNEGVHFGGQVAAPVFAAVMRGAVRILDIPPDDTPALENRAILAGAAAPVL